MNNPFITLYDWFHKHRPLLWVVLVVWIVVSGLLASRMRFVENISSFLGDDTSGPQQSLIFDNLKLKDRMVILLDGQAPDSLVPAAQRLTELLQPLVEENLLTRITEGVDETTIDHSIAFLYDYLPIFLTDSDYLRIEAALDSVAVDQALQQCYEEVASPSGLLTGSILLGDPLHIGTPLLSGLQQFGQQADYTLYDGHIFSSDTSTLLFFIDPTHGMGSTGPNDKLIHRLEKALETLETETGVQASYFGGSAIAVYNARQIKHDTWLTMTIALVLIVLVITFALRSRSAMLLIVLPVLFGGLFALALLALIQGEISSIAIGAGAAVFGIALSYSIHVVSHHTHTPDPRQVIAELAYPMTVGSFTTIGAFVALLFTHSALLQDFGAFAALTLVGTTLFCLIFLPHLLPVRQTPRPSPLMRLIDRINSYAYEQNRVLVGILILLTVVGCFFYSDVRFDSDLNHLNFEPKEIVAAEQRLKTLTGGQGDLSRIYLVTHERPSATTSAYGELTALLDSLQHQGRIQSYVSMGDYFVSPTQQQQRIARWNDFWATRRAPLLAQIERQAPRYGLQPQAFQRFAQRLERTYTPCQYSTDELSDVPLFADWINPADSAFLLVSQIELRDSDKPAVYQAVEQTQQTAIVDRAYYSSLLVDNLNDDFNFILFVSSFLVFGALLLSYGRIELALLSLMPMLVSWVIILGLMALLDIPFNIVNIVLSTFIFGIGDDFSIFIMDGLLSEYSEGRKLFKAHKTAIFFSAFTTVVGLGALLFADHPALKSIALISVLGMAVVLLVSYTLQPILFNGLVMRPTRRGNLPYTLLSLIRTLYAFTYFLAGCLLVQGVMLLMFLIPLRRPVKQRFIHYLIYRFVRIFLRSHPGVHITWLDRHNETLRKPAILIANHQSFIDILMMLALSPRVVMVTNHWVWNSPVFGWVVRYLGYFPIGQGHEQGVETVRKRVAEGYSVVIFPEGTRSEDETIGRFHKGAFYLAETLQLDLLPVVFYGTGHVAAKRQPFYIRPGDIVTRLYPRVTPQDPLRNESLRTQAKYWRHWFQKQYALLCDTYSRANDPYFRNALRKNYLYKGPHCMWQVYRQMARARYYDAWDRLLPRNATITEIGCEYGARAVMLGVLSRQRQIRGLVSDPDTLLLAQHGFLNHPNISFERLTEGTLPESDIYILAKGYLAWFETCLAHLKPGGQLILESVSELPPTHRALNLHTEVWGKHLLITRNE